MHHHARLTHGTVCGLVQAKTIQLTNLYSAETPCGACGVIFSHTHSCNVWYQVALVALHALRARHQLVDLMHDPAPHALRCEICDLMFTSEADLRGHLREVHQLASTVWHQARDSREGQSTCNHCGQRFKTMEGLRSHINQGRCKKFNPDSSTEPAPAKPVWTQAIRQGQLEEIMRDARNRLTLTLPCQCCTRRYGRAIDLAAHLQTAHPQLWMRAQPLAMQMVQSLYGNEGCVCNPSCNVTRHQHVCLPYIQLAMHFCRLDNAIYMPTSITTVDLARVLPPHFPNDLRQNLEQAFIRFDLERLWTDAGGHVSGCGDSPKISCTSSGTLQHSRAVETPVGDSGGSPIRAHAPLVSEPGLDSARRQLEDPQPSPEHSGNPARDRPGPECEKGLRQREESQSHAATAQAGERLMLTRDDMVRIVSRMVFANPNNWCFANVAVYNLLWTLLTFSAFEPGIWGEQCDAIMSFLQRVRTQTGNLSTETFFRDVLHCWGRSDLASLTHSISQEDSAEFVRVWLRMMNTHVFDMRWEKRVLSNDAVRIVDGTTEPACPIRLQFDEFTLHLQFCDLSRLALIWHQVDGMCTALLHGTSCVCLHIDRCRQDSDGSISKIDCKLCCDDECFLPVYSDDRLSSYFLSYQVVCLMSHLGSDGAGHYRSALKVQPMVMGTTHPIRWLLTDDWREPSVTWTLPDWFLRNVTMVWLVRSDHMHCPSMRHFQPKNAIP